MATCSQDSTVKIWNLNTDWTLIRNYTNHSKVVYALDWINEDTIASGSLDTTLQIWSISTGLIQRRIPLTINGVYSLKMLSNGLYLACGTRNGPLYIYSRPSLIQTR